MRSDAALHNAKGASASTWQNRSQAKYGPRLPSPREIAKRADRGSGRWRRETVEAFAFGEKQKFIVCCFVAVWPRVFGTRPVKVVVFALPHVSWTLS